jgi:hypothetical protein
LTAHVGNVKATPLVQPRKKRIVMKPSIGSRSLLGLVSALALFQLPSAYAKAGVGAGGGGDLCEDRIQVIVADIQSWIGQGGPQGLSLPQGVSVQRYSEVMLQQISNVKAECVGRHDPGYPVLVDGTPKVCKFKNGADGGKITCDYAKFMAINESDQYVLIHHELAGIAGLELPKRDDSHYDISNQISGYLVDQVVKKLAVNPASARPIDEANFTFFRFGDIEYAVSKARFTSETAAESACTAGSGFTVAHIVDYLSLVMRGVVVDGVKLEEKGICIDPSFSYHTCDPSGLIGWLSSDEYNSLFAGEYKARGEPMPAADIFTILDGQGTDPNPELLSNFNQTLKTAGKKTISLPAVCVKH